jgi:hypothetical protein
MPELMDVMTQLTQDDTVSRMSRQLGVDEQSTRSAVAAALPLLMSALARNSSSSDGATSLHRALEKDHDGSLLDDLPGFLNNAQAGSGAGILKHLLGERREASQDGLARASGLDKATMGRLLVMLAPLILAALGRAQRKQWLDSPGLAGMIQSEHQNVERNSPDLMGLATRMLDQDGDGSFMNEVGGLMGKLLGRR